MLAIINNLMYTTFHISFELHPQKKGHRIHN